MGRSAKEDLHDATYAMATAVALLARLVADEQTQQRFWRVLKGTEQKLPAGMERDTYQLIREQLAELRGVPGRGSEPES